MTLQERLKQEAALLWHGQRACLPSLLHEAAARLDALESLIPAAQRLLRAMDDYDGNVPASLDSPYMRMKDAVAAVEPPPASRSGKQQDSGSGKQ